MTSLTHTHTHTHTQTISFRGQIFAKFYLHVPIRPYNKEIRLLLPPSYMHKLPYLFYKIIKTYEKYISN